MSGKEAQLILCHNGNDIGQNLMRSYVLVSNARADDGQPGLIRMRN